MVYIDIDIVIDIDSYVFSWTFELPRVVFPSFLSEVKGLSMCMGLRGIWVDSIFNIFYLLAVEEMLNGTSYSYCKSRIIIKKLDAFIRQSFFKPKSLHLILIIILQSRHFCLPSGMSCKRMREFLKARRRRGPITGFCFPATCQCFSF